MLQVAAKDSTLHSRLLNNIKMTENKLYASDNNVTFNGQVVDGEVDNNDPMVTLTGYISKSMVLSQEAALRNRCKVQSDLRNIYRCVINEYIKNSVAYFTSRPRGPGVGHRTPLNRVQHDMKEFLRCVNEKHYTPNQRLPVTSTGVTETILRGLLRQRCHYVGFAVGETRERHPKRDPVMAHDKLKNNHIAVNRGGNITVKADEQIDTGDYVLVDFDWEDFGKVWNELKEGDGSVSESALSAFGTMKLKIKSFKKCARRCLHVASQLKPMDNNIPSRTRNEAFNAYTQAQCVIHGCAVGSKELDLIDHPNFVKLFASLAPSVIAQCKSGCTKGSASDKQMIDIKLESHIDKRSFRFALDEVGKIEATEQGDARGFIKHRMVPGGPNGENVSIYYSQTCLLYGEGFDMTQHLERIQNRRDFLNELQQERAQLVRMIDAEDDNQIQNEGISILREHDDEIARINDEINATGELIVQLGPIRQQIGDVSRWVFYTDDTHEQIRRLTANLRITGARHGRMKDLIIQHHNLLNGTVSVGDHDPAAAPAAPAPAAPAAAPPRESSTASPPTPAAPPTPTTTTEASSTMASKEGPAKKSKKKAPMGPK